MADLIPTIDSINDLRKGTFKGTCTAPIAYGSCTKLLPNRKKCYKSTTKKPMTFDRHGLHYLSTIIEYWL